MRWYWAPHRTGSWQGAALQKAWVVKWRGLRGGFGTLIDTGYACFCALSNADIWPFSANACVQQRSAAPAMHPKGTRRALHHSKLGLSIYLPLSASLSIYFHVQHALRHWKLGLATHVPPHSTCTPRFSSAALSVCVCNYPTCRIVPMMPTKTTMKPA